MAQLDLSVSPESVELSNNAVIITWPSSLPSRYGSEWLRSRNLFELRVKTARKSLNLDRKILWSAKEFHSKHLRWHKFSQILTDDSKLLECLEDFLKFGLVLMDEVPTQLGQLQLLTKRIGLGYPTHYGWDQMWIYRRDRNLITTAKFRSFFSVKSDVNPTNVAYTSGPIGLHVDLPYLQYPPQVEFAGLSQSFHH